MWQMRLLGNKAIVSMRQSMSYEGYSQKLCARGHLCEIDVCDDVGDECFCGEDFVFKNKVDDTNSDSFGIIPDFEWEKLERPYSERDFRYPKQPVYDVPKDTKGIRYQKIFIHDSIIESDGGVGYHPNGKGETRYVKL